jgi:hypothetical protein
MDSSYASIAHASLRTPLNFFGPSFTTALLRRSRGLAEQLALRYVRFRTAPLRALSPT